jgi:hypothetical protein
MRTPFDIDQFDLGTRQIDGGGNQIESGHARGDRGLGDAAIVDEKVVARSFAFGAIDAESGRGIALRIEIDDEDLPAGRGERGADVDGGRRLADAALLVSHCDTNHRAGLRRTPSAMTIAASGSVTLGTR